MKRVIDFLRTVEALGTDAVYWMRGEDENPLWEGSLHNTPWWVSELKLDYEEADDHQPISFRENLGKTHNNKAGFIFLVKED